MTFDLEIMLRHEAHVFTERLTHDRHAADWTADDAKGVMKDVLRAVDRAINPDGASDGAINLRGVSWIVHPYKDGVVIALEIHTASAVVGPFRIPQARLEQLLSEAMRHDGSQATVH